MVELVVDGTYWNINTAGVFRTSYGRKVKEVYNRHATEKQPAETAEASQNVQQSGTDTVSSMNAPTLPSDKSNEKVADLKTEGRAKGYLRLGRGWRRFLEVRKMCLRS